MNDRKRGTGFVLLALALAGCAGRGSGGGGGGDGGEDDAGDDGGDGGLTEPQVGFACKGTVTDTTGDSISLPGPPQGGTVAIDICGPENLDLGDAAAKCDMKCDMELAEFAAAINQANADAGNGDPTVSTSQLTCTFSDTELLPSDPGCPVTDPPGQPEPAFTGGPAQNAASLSGSVGIAADTGTPLGTVSTTTTASGRMEYSILPLDRGCPPEGCELLVTSLALSIAPFQLSASFVVTLFDDSVTNMSVLNVGWVTGTWQPNGKFVIPAQAARAVVSLDLNESPVSFDQANASDITGTIDPVTGAVTFDTFSESELGTTFTIDSLSGPQVAEPPVAVISVPESVECTGANGTAVTLDGTASTAPGSALHFFAWTVNGGAVISGARAPAALQLGSNAVVLNVFNANLGVGLAEETVSVVDTTPPNFGPLPAIAETLCSPTTQPVTLTVPVAADACSAQVSVRGAVTSANGKTLATPIPIALAGPSGSVQLSPGTFVVTWTATDGSGNQATAKQALTVRPGIEANGSFSVDDSAVVRLPNGAPAAIANTGTGPVTIGVAGETGAVMTEGSVWLRSRAVVQGGIQAAGSLTEQNPVTVTGPIATGASVSLPEGSNLTGIVFPSPLGAAIDLEPGVTRTLAPGAYTSVSVKSRATLTLASGVYFVGALDLEPQSTLNLNQASGAVQLYVQSSVIDRGQIDTISGAPSSFVLGYAGTSTFFVERPFPGGVVLAPNADVVIGSLGADAFAGELFAQSIEVEPDATLTCETSVPGAAPEVRATALRATDVEGWGDDLLTAPSSPGSTESASGGCSVASLRARRGGGAYGAFALAGGAAVFARRRRRGIRSTP